MQLTAGAEGTAEVIDQGAHTGLDSGLGLGIECPQTAPQLYGVGDNIVGTARLHLGHADHGAVEGVGAAADQAL